MTDNPAEEQALPDRWTFNQSVRIEEPGQLIASVPYLLGFFPADSLVLLALHNGRATLTLRCDLPVDGDGRALIERLDDTLARHGADEVVVVIIGGGTADALPHQALVTALRETLAQRHVPVAAYGVPAVRHGAPWWSYDEAGDAGNLSDPHCTDLAAATTAMGFVTHSSREALTATLTPASSDVLARRVLLIDEGDDQPPHNDYSLIKDQVSRAAGRAEPLTDEEIADLGRALRAPIVRDACIAFAISENAESAERLWTELTRECPAPERAEPAVLLALSSYIRGDGVLASIALDAADTALPGHRLAALIRSALDCGLAPSSMRELAAQALDGFPSN